MFHASILFAATLLGPAEAISSLTVAELRENALDGKVAPDLQPLVAEFAPFASAHDLMAHFSSDSPLALFSAARTREAGKLVELLDRSFQVFQERYPEPTEGGAPFAVIHLSERKAYEELIDLLIEEYPYLGSWGPTAKSLPGFAIYEPPLCVLLEDKRVRREFNRDNLLVHLAGHVLLYQSQDVQPYWVREGAALDLEATVTNKVYSFCHSNGFVPKGKAAAWRTETSAAWRKARTKGRGVENVLGLSNQRFDRNQSLQALGLVRYLLREHQETFAAFLGEVRSDRRSHLHQDVNHIATPSAQREMLDGCFGEEDWEKLALRELIKKERTRR